VPRPTRGVLPDTGGKVSAAQAVCRQCPVQDECLAYALAHERTVRRVGWDDRTRNAPDSAASRPCPPAPNAPERQSRTPPAGCTAQGRTKTDIGRVLVVRHHLNAYLTEPGPTARERQHGVRSTAVYPLTASRTGVLVMPRSRGGAAMPSQPNQHAGLVADAVPQPNRASTGPW